MPLLKSGPVQEVMKQVFLPVIFYRMYMKYCEKKGFRTALLSESEGTVGGYKEVQLEVTGEDVYGTLKFESGVHRVQRVPDTEQSGQGTYECCYGCGNARSRRSGF